jgi:signal transduction histidine kinase/DNA-binding response OmpR family regulator
MNDAVRMHRRVTVLLADDSPTQLGIVQSMLEESGFHVVTACNGIDGVNRAYTDSPDIIVSDVVMPELNGYQFCRLIKNDWFTAHIPVILLTSLGQRQDKFWGTECGADVYLTKEEDLERLPDEIRRLTRERPARQSPLRDTVLVSASELASATVKSRVNYLLDRLLFQSVVANRIREITRCLNDERAMIEEFFTLLDHLEDYEVGILGFQVADEVHLHVHAAHPTSHEMVRRMRSSACAALGVADAAASLRVSVYDGAQVAAESVARPDHVRILSEELQLGPDRRGFLGVARATAHPFDSENENTFGIVARELSVVAGYFIRAYENEKLQSDFTSMMVHDLRTPMSGIRGYAEILSAGAAGPVSSQQQDMLDSVVKLSSRVVEMVSDFLDVSKIEAGRLDLSEDQFALSEPARSASASIAPLAGQKNIRLSVNVHGEDMQVVGDAKRLEQVFINLLSNAVKFTPADGEIRVDLRASPERWIARVIDTGLGIPPEEMAELFTKYKSGSAKRGVNSATGTGLGLVIVKRIIEAHGGTVSVESTPGSGTTFTITMPHRSRQEARVVGL